MAPALFSLQDLVLYVKLPVGIHIQKSCWHLILVIKQLVFYKIFFPVVLIYFKDVTHLPFYTGVETHCHHDCCLNYQPQLFSCQIYSLWYP